MQHKEVASLEPAEFQDMWDLAEKVLLSIALPLVVLFVCCFFLPADEYYIFPHIMA
jgi:hypothetical protein